MSDQDEGEAIEREKNERDIYCFYTGGLLHNIVVVLCYFDQKKMWVFNKRNILIDKYLGNPTH